MEFDKDFFIIFDKNEIKKKMKFKIEIDESDGINLDDIDFLDFSLKDYIYDVFKRKIESLFIKKFIFDVDYFFMEKMFKKITEINNIKERQNEN